MPLAQRAPQVIACHTRSDGAVLGFVDVPGHEGFIRTMLAGVAAIDYALLIVAAGDGPMPQTREQLAILDLLGVDSGAVVRRLAEVAEGLAAASDDGRCDAKTFRDTSGIGRNLTIQVLEFFDGAGLTRRIGDTRIVVRRAADLFG